MILKYLSKMVVKVYIQYKKGGKGAPNSSAACTKFYPSPAPATVIQINFRINEASCAEIARFVLI